MKTYGEIYLAAGKELRGAGIEASNLEARVMAAAAAGKTVAAFLRDAGLYVADDAFENRLKDMIRRRLEGEPVAYITGQWEFHGLPLLITGDVLIPRDDTEVLVDAALDVIRAKGPDTRVLDLCCGSGCIGLALASAMRGVRVIMADVSEQALAVARQNALRNNLTKNVTCLAADATQTPPLLFGWFDVIVCNPPYIPTDELEKLDASVRDYEPRGALDGGEDGLDFFRAVADRWRSVMKSGGVMLFECGEDQSGAVADILKKNSFTDIRKYRDTRGTERVVSGRYAGNQK